MEKRVDATDEQHFSIRILSQRRQGPTNAKNDDASDFHGVGVMML